MSLTPGTRLGPYEVIAPIGLDRGPLASFTCSAQWLTGDRGVLVCGWTSAGVSRCYTLAIDGGAPVPVTAEGTDVALLAPDGRTLAWLARELAPPDRSALAGINVDQWMDDGRAYEYGYVRTLSRLVVASRGK